MMCGLIDLNTVNDDVSVVTPVVCCLELWHACAGPLVSLPRKGNAVVYCPQGHLEQLQSAGKCVGSGEFSVPPHVFCRVVDVKLHAEAGTDDVYAQVSLVQDSQLEQKWHEVGEGGRGVEYAEEDDNEVIEKSTTPHMFCKTLTASDTSTHGGFSVPRRAAEDCFPPLDYKQQRPSQELVAKDLHGFDWKFRHIYRGQPRRHLLTTGWSAFVNKKKLICGDAVLFLRGDDGVLRLGIRRATQVKPASSFPPFFGHQLNDRDFSNVVNSISQRTIFSVYYNPRGGSSKFIVPYNRFMKSLANSFSPGMRFKMRVETEDAGDRRCTGIITGLNDIDPARWPGSKWRCIMVRWDCGEIARHNRISPWEIDRCSSLSEIEGFMSPLMKRTRTGFPSLNSDFTVLKDRSTEGSDFEESMRFHKVLQGQEIYGFYRSSEISPLGNDIRNQISVGSGESSRFNRVLQGQEIISNLQYAERGSNSGNLWIHPSSSSSSSSSPSSVLRFQQAVSQAPNACAIRYGDNMKPLSGQNQDYPSKSQQEEPVLTSTNSCRLFGFSLTEGSNGTKAPRVSKW
ncbi:putative transcription factor ARF family [Helianthus annuus]|nr:putative transcription factor ARF family [Helianthus annuus]